MHHQFGVFPYDVFFWKLEKGGLFPLIMHFVNETCGFEAFFLLKYAPDVMHNFVLLCFT